MSMSEMQWGRSPVREPQEDEARELLASQAVGRVVFVDDQGPVALPVNYVVTEEGPVFRTAPHNTIARYAQGRQVAFEVDEVDPFTRSGWSVLIRGRARFLESEHELPDEVPDTWAEGGRWLFVCVRAEQITARRLLPS